MEETKAVPAAVPAAPAKGHVALRQTVEETLSNSGQAVRERVKEHLVNEELTSRTKLALDGIKKLSEAKHAIHKVKPDQVSHDENGKVLTQSYSKAKADERKKAVKLAEKLENALNSALDDNKYDALKKLVGGDKGQCGDKGEKCEEKAEV